MTQDERDVTDSHRDSDLTKEQIREKRVLETLSALAMLGAASGCVAPTEAGMSNETASAPMHLEAKQVRSETNGVEADARAARIKKVADGEACMTGC